MTPEQIAVRYSVRPGYRLVDYMEVALPVYRLNLAAFTVVHKPMPPIEDFILRTIGSGIKDPNEIADFLGLHTSVVEGALTCLIQSDDVVVNQLRGAIQGSVDLTEKGKQTLETSVMIRPQEESIVIEFDGLLRRPIWYGRLQLLSPKQCKEEGVREIQTFQPRPEIDDIKLVELSDYVANTFEKKDIKKIILNVRSVERRQLFYLRSTGLLYKAVSDDQLMMAFAVDGRLSIEHENAFAQLSGLQKMRIVDEVQPREGRESEVRRKTLENLGITEKDLEPVREIQREIESTKEELLKEEVINASVTKPEEVQIRGKIEAARLKLSFSEAKIAEFSVRPLPVYEHPPILEKALSEAKERLLIISPWIRAKVVDKDFVRRIEELLQNRVTVYIGYGLGPDYKGNQADNKVIYNLKKLSEKHKDLFLFKEFGDTHAKVLIQDDKYFVITSFNWLSFRGDPKRTFREEWGTYVGEKKVVERYFEELRERFNS